MAPIQTEPRSHAIPIRFRTSIKIWHPFKGLLLLLLLPVLAYAGVMSVSVLRRNPLTFDVFDLALLILVLTYCGIGICLSSCRRALWLVRFLTCVYSILIAGAFAEATMWLVCPPLKNTPFPRIHAIYYPNAKMGGITGPIEFTVNDLGIRGPALRLEDVDLRILCVGGSTTECLYQTDKLSWPWLLQDKLACRLGKAVYVGNAGRSGHILLNHSFLLRHYPVARRFEWVVVLCGINDLAAKLTLQNYEYRKATLAETTLYNFGRSDHDAYYRDLATVQRLKEMRKKPLPGIHEDTAGYWIEEQRRKRQAALKIKAIHEVPRAKLDSALAEYRANLAEIIAICRRQKQHLLMLTQPSIYRKDLPKPLEELTWSWMSDGAYTTAVLEQLMNAYNQAMMDVCKQQGVDCLDLAAGLPKDATAFFDDVHFTNAGCDKVADMVCDYFVTKLVQQP